MSSEDGAPMQPLTLEQILAMQPGTDLDKAVHSGALGRPGVPRAYSTKQEAAIEILNKLPLGVARLSEKVAGYKADRPYIAFVLQHDQQASGYATTMTVTAATIAIALCKMALIFSIVPTERVRAPVQKFPAIGSGLKPRALDPMPKRIAAPIIPDVATPKVLPADQA